MATPSSSSITTSSSTQTTKKNTPSLKQMDLKPKPTATQSSPAEQSVPVEQSAPKEQNKIAAQIKPAEEIAKTGTLPALPEQGLAKENGSTSSPQGEKKKGKGRGCMLPSCSCKSCSCFGCLGIIFVVVVIGAILYFRPPFIWNTIKSFLNDGYEPTAYQNVAASDVIKDISTELEQDSEVEITELQLQALVQREFDSDQVRVDVEPSFFRVVLDIEDDNDRPLWLIFEIGQQSDDNLKVTKIGFERIDAPDFLQDRVSDSAFGALEVTGAEGENDAIRLVSTLIDAEDQGITVESLRFDKDKITIEGTK